MIYYPSLEKLQEYADEKGKEDLKDEATEDPQSLKTYLDQIKYNSLSFMKKSIIIYFYYFIGQWQSEENL